MKHKHQMHTYEKASKRKRTLKFLSSKAHATDESIYSWKIDLKWINTNSMSLPWTYFTIFYEISAFMEFRKPDMIKVVFGSM